jgi:hypothetical protein
VCICCIICLNFLTFFNLLVTKVRCLGLSGFKTYDVMEFLCIKSGFLCVVDITTMCQVQDYHSTLTKEMRMAYILAVLLHLRACGP